MTVKKGTSAKGKRKSKAKSLPPRAKNVVQSEPHAANANGKLGEENGFKDLVLMGDEVGDPDISMLA